MDLPRGAASARAPQEIYKSTHYLILRPRHGIAAVVLPTPYPCLAFAMRISHILLMRELKSVYATRLPVAFAPAASILSVPAAEIAARPSDSGDAITGNARVIDGDTISIGQVRIRLEGIDAHEIRQT